MQTIYIMDTEMPIPKNKSNIHSLEDVKGKDILKLNTSYTIFIIDWAQNEFQKIFKTIKIQSGFKFQDILAVFFQSLFLVHQKRSLILKKIY